MKFYGKAEAVGNQVIEAFKTGNVPAIMATIFIHRSGNHASTLSWSNQMLIALAGHSDAMGFGAKDKSSGWLSVGRCVNKGEKATYILAPCVTKIDDPKSESGKRTIIRGFRSVAVFGIDQTSIVNAELWAEHNAGNEASDRFMADLPLREVAEAWGLTLQAYNGKSGQALGWYRHGQAIAIGVENLATWAHELVHAADDKNGTLIEHGQHWRSEVVAELGGAILMKVMGYETDADLGGAWNYISKYASTAKLDPIKACMNVLKRTCEAVDTILHEADELSKSDKPCHSLVV